MNLGIKDGSHWRRYHMMYPKDTDKTIIIMIMAWTACIFFWTCIKWIPWISPIILVWSAFGLLWHVRLGFSWYYNNKWEKQLMEDSDREWAKGEAELTKAEKEFLE